MARVLFGSALGLAALVLAVLALSGFLGAFVRPKPGVIRVLDRGESFCAGLFLTFCALCVAAWAAAVFGW